MHKTALHSTHLKTGAKMVDFGGWHMPINYGSQINEHHSVRKACGMFDVSHMTVIDIEGKQSTEFLMQLFANDVSKLSNLKALYSTMLNEQGGIIDDLIVYRINNLQYRIVVNAATREKDIAWFQKNIQKYECDMQERNDLCIIAVQGPNATKHCEQVLSQPLTHIKRFHAGVINNFFIGRTGYTGEDGFEVILPESDATLFWEHLLESGVSPCGLGSRDTLRLEAGMHLYGQDMDENISPLECGLGWTVRKNQPDFIGSQALNSLHEKGISRKQIGLVLNEKGILRQGQPLNDANGNTGIITSGGYSPTTEKAIALAIVDSNMNGPIHVKIRNKFLSCHTVSPPFVRNGKSYIE